MSRQGLAGRGWARQGIGMESISIPHEGLIYCVSLPFTLTNGNDGRGKAFWRSKADRDRFERDLRKLGMVRRPFPFPVIVRAYRVYGKGKRKWDSSSILRGNYKELEDALVACGWFNDDSPKWIVRTIPEQVKGERDCVELWIYKATEGEGDERERLPSVF